MSNLKGSAAANILSAVFFLVFWVLKNKCKHMECKSHTRFCTCKIKEDDDPETGQRRINRQETLKIPNKVKINLRELHIVKHHGVLPECEKAIPSD